MSYSSDYADLTRILARQVDKLLKDIALPPAFLARTDEVIE